MIKALLPDNVCSDHNMNDDDGDRTKSLDTCIDDIESKPNKQSGSSTNSIGLHGIQKQNDHIINNILNISSSEQQAPVPNHPIQLLESLTVRLDKIEDDTNNNQQDVMNLINKVETLSLHIGSSSRFNQSEASMVDVHDRLVLLETFLEGFSVANSDLIDSEEFVHSKQTKTLDTKHDHLLSDIESGKEAEKVNEWSNTKVEIVEPNSSPERIDTEHKDETGLKKQKEILDNVTLMTIETDLPLKKDEKQQHTLEYTLQNSEALNTLRGESDKSVTKPIIVSRINDVVVGSRGDSNEINLNLITRPNTENVSAGQVVRGNKIRETLQHNLLTRLLDQENQFKSSIDLMMNRIVKLEEDNTNKLKNDVLISNCIGLEGKDTVCENVKHDCNESNNIAAQICEINNALNLVREEMNSKLSRQTIVSKILDLDDSNDEKQTIDENIKEFYKLVQDEIECLKEHKVDRDLFINEIEETKANLTNFSSQSISSQEAKLSNALTSVEIDIASCRHNIECIEKSIESIVTENEDVGLYEKIKSATNLMETSLQETISSRLKCLNVLEDEVEKITSYLAEKPNQDQINEMVKNLEEAVSQRLGSDEAFKSMLQNIKTGELTKVNIWNRY